MARDMTDDRWSTVDTYITNTLVKTDAALDSALETSEAAGLPAINVSPSHGKLLHILVRLVNARAVLELGTLGGYSSIWMALARYVTALIATPRLPQAPE